MRKTVYSPATEDNILQYLRSLPLPKLDFNAQNELNPECSHCNKRTGVKRQLGPDGSDGLGTELYNAYADDVAPLLLRMFNESILNKKLPELLYTANISLVLKKEKDKTDPSSYGPTALLGHNLRHSNDFYLKTVVI